MPRDPLARTLSIVAAGVAPSTRFLAWVPALIAVVAIYGLVANPADVKDQIISFTSAAPRDAERLLSNQLTSITRGAGGGTSIAAAIVIGAALWSASSGIVALNTGINHRQPRDRNPRVMLKRRPLALALTLFAVVGVLLTLALVVALPSLLDSAGISGIGSTALELARWPLLAILLLDGLAVIFRYGPQRRRPRWRWISPGAVVAMIVGLVASIGFSIYLSLLGNYNKTYGVCGAIIVVLLWLYLMAFAVLCGAAMNAELEHQTMRDTTAGDERLMGERGSARRRHRRADPQRALGQLCCVPSANESAGEDRCCGHRLGRGRCWRFRRWRRRRGCRDCEVEDDRFGRLEDAGHHDRRRADLRIGGHALVERERTVGLGLGIAQLGDGVALDELDVDVDPALRDAAVPGHRDRVSGRARSGSMVAELSGRRRRGGHRKAQCPNSNCSSQNPAHA